MNRSLYHGNATKRRAAHSMGMVGMGEDPQCIGMVVHGGAQTAEQWYCNAKSRKVWQRNSSEVYRYGKEEEKYMDDMDIRVEIITPEIAKEYLSKNHVINRRMRRLRVMAYAYDMRNGAWQFNGEAIRFDRNGNLVDGQHRLAAIIQAGVPIKMVVMRNVDECAIYDRGAARSTTDSLVMAGFDIEQVNSTNVAVARLHYSLVGRGYTITDFQVLQFLQNHKDALVQLKPLISKNHNAENGRLSTKGAPILLASLYAIECGEDVAQIIQFANVYSSGIVTDVNQSAAVVCRNDVISNNIRPNGGGVSDRVRAVHIYEKAIYDFCRKYGRTKTYKAWKDPIYSNNEMFRTTAVQ